MTNNLPENDDAPWLNLTPQEVEELRYNKQELTSYGREKIRALMEEKKLLKECRQTGRTTATTEKVLKTVFSQMTDKKTLECEIEEYALRIEQQLKQMKETDISKVLIEGDTATINGIKYKRVEEPKPKKLFDVIRNLGYSVDMCYEIVDAVEEWLPKLQQEAGDTEVYYKNKGWNNCIKKMKEMLR